MSLAIDVERYMSNKPPSFWRTRKSSMGEAVATAPGTDHSVPQPQQETLKAVKAEHTPSSVFRSQGALWAATAVGTAAGLAVGAPMWLGAAGLVYGMWRGFRDGIETGRYWKSRHDARVFTAGNDGAGIAQTPSVPKRILNFLRLPIATQFEAMANRIEDKFSTPPSRTQVMKMAGYGAAISAMGPAAIVLALAWEGANLTARGAEYVVYSTLVNDPKTAGRNFRDRQKYRDSILVA